MTKNKEFTEVLGILEDVYGWNDTNELTEMQAELVNDVISVVKKLTIPVVSQRSKLFVLFADWLQYNGKWMLPKEQVKEFFKQQKETK